MEKKKLDHFRKRLEERQQDLRRMVTKTEQDGRTVDSSTMRPLAKVYTEEAALPVS